MSATLDAWSFAKYFATVTKNGTLTAPCFEIEPKRQFEVLVYYLESLSQDAKKVNTSFNRPPYILKLLIWYRSMLF